MTTHGTGRTPLTDEQRRVVEANTGLIWWQINRWRLPEERRDDAFGDGVFGLMRAAQLYDPAKGFTFSTYATWWIRQAIQRGGEIADKNYHRARQHHDDSYEPAMSIDIVFGDSFTFGDHIPADTDVEGEAASASEAERLTSELIRFARDDLDLAIIYAALDNGDHGFAATVARRFGVSRQTVVNRVGRLRARVRHPAASGRKRIESAA